MVNIESSVQMTTWSKMVAKNMRQSFIYMAVTQHLSFLCIRFTSYCTGNCIILLLSNALQMALLGLSVSIKL